MGFDRCGSWVLISDGDQHGLWVLIGSGDRHVSWVLIEWVVGLVVVCDGVVIDDGGGEGCRETGFLIWVDGGGSGDGG